MECSGFCHKFSLLLRIFIQKKRCRSVVNREGIAAFFTLIENSATLIHRSSLHHIIFELRVVTLRTSFLYDHLSFAPMLAMDASLVLPQPLLISCYVQLGSHYFAWVREQVPANYWKLRWLPQIWQIMLSAMVYNSIRPPQTGQKSVWKLSDYPYIVDYQSIIIRTLRGIIRDGGIAFISARGRGANYFAWLWWGGWRNGQTFWFGLLSHQSADCWLAETAVIA